MDVLLLVSLVTFAEQCLYACVSGHIRTGSLISYIRPQVYHQTTPDLQLNNVWHQLLKKHSRVQRAQHGDVGKHLSHYPYGYRTKKQIYAEKPEKRFFQYSPYILERPRPANPLTPLKSAHLDRHSQSSSNIKPFVDHFAGVRSWALPFYVSKQTEPKTLNEQEEYNALGDKHHVTTQKPHNDDSLTSSDRLEKLTLVEKMISSLSTKSALDPPSSNIEEKQPVYEDYIDETTGDKGPLSEFIHAGEQDVSNSDLNQNMFDEQIVETRTPVGGGEPDNNIFGSVEQHAPGNVESDPTVIDLDWIKGSNSEQYGTDEPTSTNWDDFSTFSDDIDTMSNYDFEDPFTDPYNDYAWATDYGEFITDDSGCENIETKTCSGDSECNCYGIYFCVKGTCQISSGGDDLYDDTDEIQDMFWHEGPDNVYD